MHLKNYSMNNEPQIVKDRDTIEQNILFEQYLNDTEELEDRARRGKALSYDEVEWDAFQYGWNSAKAHFGIKS